MTVPTPEEFERETGQQAQIERVNVLVSQLHEFINEDNEFKTLLDTVVFTTMGRTTFGPDQIDEDSEYWNTLTLVLTHVLNQVASELYFPSPYWRNSDGRNGAGGDHLHR